MQSDKKKKKERKVNGNGNGKEDTLNSPFVFDIFPNIGDL
jgi:hypothetical protein